MALKPVPGFVFILVTYHFHTRCLTSLVARLSFIVRMRQSQMAITGFGRNMRFAATALFAFALFLIHAIEFFQLYQQVFINKGRLHIRNIPGLTQQQHKLKPPKQQKV